MWGGVLGEGGDTGSEIGLGFAECWGSSDIIIID